jgi:hypothetical protein
MTRPTRGGNPKLAYVANASAIVRLLRRFRRFAGSEREAKSFKASWLPAYHCVQDGIASTRAQRQVTIGDAEAMRVAVHAQGTFSLIWTRYQSRSRR